MPTTLREFQRLWRARRLLFLAAAALPKAEEEEALCAQALALLGLPDVSPWFLSVAFEMVRTSWRWPLAIARASPETRAVHAAARALVGSLVSSHLASEASELVYTARLRSFAEGEASEAEASFRQRLDQYVVCLEAWCLAEAFPNALLRTARTMRFAATWWAQRHTTK